jgi:hypothetical protein
MLRQGIIGFRATYELVITENSSAEYYLSSFPAIDALFAKACLIRNLTKLILVSLYC